MHKTHQASPSVQTPVSLAPLACISPLEGAETRVCVVALLIGGGAYSVGASLMPLAGTLGAMLILISGAIITERLTRPLVLLLLGWGVYRSLCRLGGKQLAGQVARHYAAGGSLNSAQLTLMLHAQNRKSYTGEGREQ